MTGRQASTAIHDAARSPVRQRAILVAAAVAVLLALASAAWACSPQAYIYLDPVRGQAGVPVTVIGSDFVEGPVEIRWRTEDGQLLGETTGPDFSMDVTLPDVPAGNYLIVARGFDAEGAVAGMARASYEVVGDDTSGDEQTSGPSEEQSSPTSPQDTSDEPSTTDATSADDASDVNSPVAEPTSGPAPDQTEPQQTTPAEPAGPTSEEAAVSASSPQTVASNNAPAVLTDDGRRVFGGSLGPPVPFDSVMVGGPDAHITGPTTDSAAPPTVGDHGRVGTPDRPALAIGGDPHRAASGPAPKLAIGLALFLGGLLVLTVGFGVVMLDRRKVEITAD